jgi:hypothetical protein
MSSRTDFTNRIAGVGDAEEDLGRPGIILVEPALQRFGGGGVTAFEGFEQGNGRRKRRVRDPLVQGESPGGQPLPECERKAQGRRAQRELRW